MSYNKLVKSSIFSPDIFNSSFFDDRFKSFFNWDIDDTIQTGNKLPETKLIENEKNYQFRVYVPGLSRDDLKIELKDTNISISYFKEEKEENSYFTESWTVTRKLSPDLINIEKVSAKVENGVLNLTLPKLVDKKRNSARLIEVE